MTDTDSPLVVTAWELMNKDAKLRHLRMHLTGHYSSKTNVAELTRQHDLAHEERAQLEAGIRPERWRNALGDLQELVRERDALGHEHGSTVPTADEQEVLNKIRGGLELDKPLPAGERKVLSTLVDNDFASIGAGMRQMAADTRQERLAAVEAEWKDKREEGPRYVTRIIAAAETYKQTLEQMVEDARLNGIKIIPGGNMTISVNPAYLGVEVTGEREAANKVRAEVDADLNRAMLTLERQRLRSQRIIALSGVTPEAAKVLDTVPDARVLMLEAAQQREQQKTDAGVTQ